MSIQYRPARARSAVPNATALEIAVVIHTFAGDSSAREDPVAAAGTRILATCALCGCPPSRHRERVAWAPCRTFGCWCLHYWPEG